MRKTIKVFIVIFVMLFCLSNEIFASPKSDTPVVDASSKVYDFADLFTGEEEKQLYGDIVRFIDQNALDMAVVTIDNNNKSSAMAYADDFYDYNGFGIGSTYDGLLFLIDMDTREIWISTTGTAQLIYDDYRINGILDKAYDKIINQKYYECASDFILYSDNYAKEGIPSSNKSAYIDSNGDYVVYSSSSRVGERLLGAGIFAFIITTIFMAIALSKHKNVRKKTEAKHYLKHLNINMRNDVLVSSHTSKQYISSSSSSHGGGSSTHHSSSGRSHGGGGRRF